jgi:MraZ protein
MEASGDSNVSLLLTGTFVRTVDEKQRFSIPKPLRDLLGRDHEPVLFMAPGTDGSLAIYPEQSFSQLAAQLAGDSPTAQDVRTFSRLFYAQAQRIELDRQGRLRIPADLARWAELEKGEVVLLGVRDHLEVWNRGRWEAYLQSRQAQYDEIAERAFSGRGGAAPAAIDSPPEVRRQTPR